MPKQLSLDIESFDEDKKDKPIRILHKPSVTELRVMSDMLHRSTKNDLQKVAAPFLELMKKYNFRYASANGKDVKPEPIALFEKSKAQPKDAWVQLLAMFYNEHNYTIIFDDMPKREIDLWREVLRNHFLIDDEVDKIMGKKCFSHTYWYFDTAELKEPLNRFFYVTNKKSGLDEDGYSRNRANFIFMGYSRTQMLLKEFFPDLVNIKGIETLPEDANLKTYNGEKFIFAKLLVLASLYDGGVMGKGFAKLTATMVKKMQKVLSIPDFFQTYPDAKQPPLSTALMVNYYLFFRAGRGRKKIPTAPEELVKEIIKDTYSFNAFTLPVCLPYIKGIKKSLIDSSNFTFIMNVALSLVKTHYQKGWLPLNSFIMKIRTFDHMADEHFLLIDPFYIDQMDMRNGYDGDNYIHPGNLIKQISEPFVKSLMFMLSTFGIVEIAYREPTDGDTSYYDGLQYVRLTELGKYVLEIAKSYESQIDEDNEPAFCLDDQRLLIKVLKQDSPFVPLLADFAESITPSLHRVSYDSFLRGCNSRDDVKQKINMFKQNICKMLPAVWKQFFDEIVVRCHPFILPDSQYKLIRLSPDNHELQRLVLTEPSIRKYVLKAENYMLLIKADETKQFATALRKFGYLI